ncbi:MAG: lipocalin family protein [Candidatus Acidiferrales bacterium]
MRTTLLFLQIVIFAACLTALDARSASPKVPSELIGTWDYESFTPLKNGKPFGMVHFQPGQWTVTFNQDATWVMKPPSNVNPSGQNGTYEVHGHDLDMKSSNGKPYNSFHFKIDHEGKVLTLVNQKTSITANRE